ncbi:hypothetical protein, partial [Paramuribaculum intestinale]|uniref:hypothetical protein n=1 Tax=Paramuribaculum intestinale TaxID=2094151 RepID=UPI0025AEDA4D
RYINLTFNYFGNFYRIIVFKNQLRLSNYQHTSSLCCGISDFVRRLLLQASTMRAVFKWTIWKPGSDRMSCPARMMYFSINPGIGIVLIRMD